ncbi:MAG: M20/M25/M40 family metallo-hydrolase [Planctomycetales bacterium]|nr:M20/M25/M40 family metallo-hydrolase [Planctomycetales bacterium]
MRFIVWLGFVGAYLGFASTVRSADWVPEQQVVQSAAQITEGVLRSHIRFLADDLLEGRGPSSRGDRLAQLYIATELQSLGIQPAAADGSWFQPVPLRGLRTIPPTSIQIRRGTDQLSLNHYEDVMLTCGMPQPTVSIEDAELVFVGYGIQAPEFDWDDYKDVDVRGKILVMMNNDPEDDPNLFAGRRRLYYGRWDYKYEMAAKMGAAGALIIHTTASAGYPYQVVQTSWSGEEFELAATEGPTTRLKGWITEAACERAMQLAGQDLDQLRASAQSRDFRPIPLGLRLSLTLQCDVREQMTGNVLGVLPGADPRLSKEFLVFMAHHDHLGLADQRDENGDMIYNGAVDNASGTATLLSIARAIASLPTRPKRSILFAFVGAEEQGLLGSEHFALDPPIPAGYMAAVINIDGINILGRTHDLNLIGNGKSDLDPIVDRVAKWQGRTVVPDYFPDRGYYYRSDQFSLAKVGVPGVYLHSGVNVVGRPDGWGKSQLEKWVEEIYHQPGDEYDPNWDLAGAIEDAQLLMHVGVVISNQSEMPNWIPGDEFEAARIKAIDQRDK